jgi:hypothetical protein
VRRCASATRRARPVANPPDAGPVPRQPSPPGPARFAVLGSAVPPRLGTASSWAYCPAPRCERACVERSYDLDERAPLSRRDIGLLPPRGCAPASLEFLKLADTQVTGAIGVRGTELPEWQHPARERMFFVAERDLHSGTLRALRLPAQPPKVRAALRERTDVQPEQVRILPRRLLGPRASTHGR